MVESLTELTTLGILKTKTAAITFDGHSSTDYTFTSFGIKFVNFIS